jgi:hypothetical protein
MVASPRRTSGGERTTPTHHTIFGIRVILLRVRGLHPLQRLHRCCKPLIERGEMKRCVGVHLRPVLNRSGDEIQLRDQ